MTTAVHLLHELRVFDSRSWHHPPLDKRMALLAYLACQGRWIERDRLAFLFWPDAGNEQARTNLRGLLARCRKLPFAHELETEPTRLRWSVACDVRAFRSALEREAWGEATDAYRGHLLADARLEDAGAFGEWLELEREGLREAHRLAVFRRCGELEEADLAQEAIKLLEGLLARDALDEEAVQRSMRLLAGTGGHGRALEVHRAFARSLADALDLEPTSTTQRLAERLEAGRRDPPTAAEAAPDGAPAETRPHSARAADASGPRLRAEKQALPAQLTSFLGREAELAELKRLLNEPRCRLLTVTGVGGVGKTRLALRAARQSSDGYANGASFVALASATAPEDVPREIARALGIELGRQEEAMTELVERIGDRELLMVLDNYEQLLDGAAIPSLLLRECPGLQLLVTSRERLNLAEEWLLPLKGLARPTAPITVDEAEGFDAVRFFTERAKQILPGFALDQETLPAVVRICRWVDGLPLGLELAAAWVRGMPVADIAREIEENLDFLQRGSGSSGGRHHSVRAAFEHSWKLLTPREQEVLRRLAVFRGGFRREGASHVAGASIALLAALVDKSLLHLSRQGRYGRHPLLFQYIQQKLAARPHEAAEAKERHAAYLVSLVEEVGPRIGTRMHVASRARLDAEQDNIGAALDWSIESGRTEFAMALAAAAASISFPRGRVSESGKLLARILAMPAGAPTLARARVLHRAGTAAHQQGDYDGARPLYEQSLRIARELGDARNMVRPLNNLSHIARMRGDLSRGRSLLEESLALGFDVVDRAVTANTLNNLATMDRLDGSYEAARLRHEEALTIGRDIGAADTIAQSLNGLGYLARSQGQHARARMLIEESLAVSRSLGRVAGVSASLHTLGLLAHERGDFASARSFLKESLATRWDADLKWYLAESLEAVAALIARPGEHEQAAVLWGAAEALRRDRRTPMLAPHERERHRAAVDEARRASPADFDAAWARGARIDLDHAVRRALTALGSG